MPFKPQHLKQLDDIQQVIRVQANSLDLEYLRQWAAELDVADLLNNALADAGLNEAERTQLLSSQASLTNYDRPQ